ncbi:MAG: hypothetical protein JWM11_2538 [Planctomycetaceae bacterium]|nr:hypothetical protein [Planctomycetaceae bacterium]
MTDERMLAQQFAPRLGGIATFGALQERQVLDFVEGIVRRTRLWRSEQEEVRSELLGHFDDGADAGHSLERLLKDFGLPHVAARLIRKAKLRNRSWMWQVRHRLFQTCAAGICLFLGCLFFLEARLHLGVAGTPTDKVGEMDVANATVAIADRGWPWYREGLIRLDQSPFKQLGKTPALHTISAPTDPNWAWAMQYLDANARSLDLFVKGTTHPHLGYIYRDPTNDAWLKLRVNQTSAETYPIKPSGYEILLPHYQDLMHVRTLFHLSALRALASKDLPQFRKFWQAQAGLAKQIFNDSEFIVVSGMGHVCASSAMALLRRLVSEHADLLSDEQLQAWRQELDLAKWHTKSGTATQYRYFCDELLEICFTSESDGGRFTAEGSRILMRKLSELDPDTNLAWPALLKEYKAAGLPTRVDRQSIKLDRTTEIVNQELLAIRWSTTLAGRQALRLEFERLLTLLQTYLEQPIAQHGEFAESTYHQELQRLATSPERFRRYWPVMLILPEKFREFWPEPTREEQGMEREGTLTTLALERFRRRTGNWPERLEQLVPADLPNVPLDVFSGRPLIYRIVDGQPLLYSVWSDRKDDGGTPVPIYSVGEVPLVGDFRFLPVNW